MWDQSDNATNALDMDISKPRVKVRKDASFAEKKHTDDVKKRRSVETATRTTDPHSKGVSYSKKIKTYNVNYDRAVRILEGRESEEERYNRYEEPEQWPKIPKAKNKNDNN